MRYQMKIAVFALTTLIAIPALGQTDDYASRLYQSKKEQIFSGHESPSAQVALTSKPEPRQPTAKGMDLVDGAIVCPSMDEANWLYSRINEARHARQSLSPELRKQGALLNGYDYGAEPKPSDYQCQLVPEGTPMNVRMEMGVIPVVSGKLKDGRPFAGVTIPNMVDR
jgi:hypothetical protein